MEEWRDIADYNGFYQVSNFGNVRNIAVYSYKYGRVIIRKRPRLLKPETTYDGYKRVVLSLYGKKKKYSVHRLVASAFINNPNKLQEVNHKDENTMNNRVENLEWCSRKYNSNYGTLPKRISERSKNHPSYSKEVLQFSIDGDLLNKYPSINEASRMTGAPSEVIGRCCKKKARTSGGYKWVYAKE